MLRGYLEADPWFAQGDWDAAAQRPGAPRRGPA